MQNKGNVVLQWKKGEGGWREEEHMAEVRAPDFRPEARRQMATWGPKAAGRAAHNTT